MANRKLTDKQREILEYLKECILQKGYPPAVREICEAVHLKSTSSVHAHLARREVINVPIVGTVTCGEPILAEQNIQGYFPIPPEYLHANGKNTFMLKVKGDSMINAGIFDGDLVMCEEAQTARNAEMVVALIDDSATVKTYYKEAGYYRLQPENDTMDPIIVQDGELQILGKVIGLFRTF